MPNDIGLSQLRILVRKTEKTKSTGYKVLCFLSVYTVVKSFTVSVRTTVFARVLPLTIRGYGGKIRISKLPLVTVIFYAEILFLFPYVGNGGNVQTFLMYL